MWAAIILVIECGTKKHFSLWQGEDKSDKKLSAVDTADVELANDDPQRAAWGGKIEFILTCVG